MDRLDHVTRELGLNDQEKELYSRHLKNAKNGGVKNQDGTVSSLRAMTVEVEGRTYVVPTVWAGKVLDPDEAMKRVEKEGFDRFPSYTSAAEADARYEAMHKFMEEESAAELRKRKTAQTILSTPPPTMAEPY